MKRTRTLWEDRTKTFRRNRRYRLINEIRVGPYRNFNSIDMLENNPTWIDIDFPGTNKLVIWNATVQTAANTYQDKKQGMAYSAARALMTDEENEQALPVMSLLPLGMGGSSVSIKSKPMDALGGLTKREWVKQHEHEFVPEIFEEVEVHTDWSYGYGLDITLDVAWLSTSYVEEFIDKFYAEIEPKVIRKGVIWQSEKPCIHVHAPVRMANPIRL
jgi:hypothetical protein